MSTRDRVALYAVNFFMADMEAGMGPFLGVLLQSRGWSTGAIGALSDIVFAAGLGCCVLAHGPSQPAAIPPRYPARSGSPMPHGS